MVERVIVDRGDEPDDELLLLLLLLLLLASLFRLRHLLQDNASAYFGKCDGGGVEGTAAMDVDGVAEAPMVGTISLELEGMVSMVLSLDGEEAVAIVVSIVEVERVSSCCLAIVIVVLAGSSS
jgi:hypothetical protein